MGSVNFSNICLMYWIAYTNYFIYFFSDERDAIQKKTFTKWVNKHLKKVRNKNCLPPSICPCFCKI